MDKVDSAQRRERAMNETLKAYAQRLFDDLRAQTSDPVSGGICRDTYGPGEQIAHEQMADQARALGLEVWQDHLCNTFMVWPGTDRNLPAVVIGSHLDSVPAGGNFDGAAGVVAGLVAIKALQDRSVRLRHDLVVMGIRAEESYWFQHSYIGSRGALGLLDASALDKCRVDTQRTLADHLRSAGGDPEAVSQGRTSLTPERVAAFLEVHIEQAPSLAVDGFAVAIGTAVPGNVRYAKARIVGEYGHVGLPRRFRKDAALAGADILVGLDAIWQAAQAQGQPMAVTVGEFHTDAQRHGLTIVPGEFRFSLDLRAYDQLFLQALEQQFLSLVKQVEQTRGVRIELGPRSSAPVAPANPGLSQALRDSAKALGLQAPDLLSPASHDAAAFHSAGIPFGFVFIRNPNGSHHPQEDMSIDDFIDASAILIDMLETVDQRGFVQSAHV
jgi:N-carbamoyl-L-amino-acid hydrolase